MAPNRISAPKNATREAAEAAKLHRQGTPADGASLDTFTTVSAPATPAAVSAGAAREAANTRFESSLSRDLTEGTPHGTSEAPTSIAERLNPTNAELFERLASNIPGRHDDMGADGRESEPFRDSGRAALEHIAATTFVQDEQSSGPAQSGGGGALSGMIGGSFQRNADGGSTFGRIGTPEDLGVTGDFGAKGDLGASSGAGMDVFNVSLPLGGAVSSSGELGILTGLLPGYGANPNATPSVADGALGEAILHATSPEGMAETARKHDISVPMGAGYGGAAGEAEMDDGSEGDGEGPGFLSRVLEVGLTAALTEAIEGSSAPTLIEQGKQLKEVDDGIGVGLGKTSQTKAGDSVGVKNLETEAARVGGSIKGKTPDPGQPIGPEGDAVVITPGYMAFRAAARERLHLGQGGSGDVDPADDGAAEQVPGGPPPSMLEAGLREKAYREFLFGQPSGPEAGVRGGGSIDLGNLPGDMGNIDYGPDSTGAWSGNSQTEDEADALNSLGGSGLSIHDARRDDEEEEEDDDSDAA